MGPALYLKTVPLEAGDTLYRDARTQILLRRAREECAEGSRFGGDTVRKCLRWRQPLRLAPQLSCLLRRVLRRTARSQHEAVFDQCHRTRAHPRRAVSMR